MAVGSQLLERSERPAYVRFARRAVENKAESIKQGRYVAMDRDFALITPPYSKDIIEMKAEQWLANLDADERGGRIKPEWAEAYRESYRRWQNGQEMPLNGTPIRGWGVTSPAQQEMLIRLNILTVEDLAGINDEGLRRVGMGAVELKSKAVAWLRTLNDKGPLTIENVELKKRVSELEHQLSAAEKRAANLEETLRALGQSSGVAVTIPAQPEREDITASDLLPPEEPPERAPRRK